MDMQSSLGFVNDSSDCHLQLREICGHDELAPLSAELLASSLTIQNSNNNVEMTLSGQDHILANIYRELYGDSVECYAQCVHCHNSFHMSFKLDDWLSSLGSNAGLPIASLDDGSFVLENQHGRIRFRLPTPSDLAAIRGLGADSAADILKRRCVLEGDYDHEDLDTAMMQVGPLLDSEIESECAYCETSQMVEFRLADCLLEVLEREQPLVIHEVHCIARAYRWSRSEILSMPRSVRRNHVRLILSETATDEDVWG